MDADRFDFMTRMAIAPGSRRYALPIVLAGAFGLLGLPPADDVVAGGKCKPKCGECQTCKKGSCKKTSHGRRCKKGKCKAKANGTACGSGTCQGGSCATPPSPAFCAGKNECAESGNIFCNAGGFDCFCWVRQDNAESFCGLDINGPEPNCGACTGNEVCVVLGGFCADDFGCSLPCPNPL